jgi:hypothetical protein
MVHNKRVSKGSPEEKTFGNSGVACPTIQSHYANIAMFINHQHNQFLKK